MKNIHLLPTDKPSRLGRFIDTGKLSLRTDNDIPRGENINIYITVDEEIKEGDWIGYLNLKKWVPVKYLGGDLIGSEKKIILTTDQDLIKDGVQAIDDEFLEWFVKNPSCEYVEVNIDYSKSVTNYSYKIIIPQEESKQETLTYTEAAKKEERIFNSTMMSKQETLEEAGKDFIENEMKYSFKSMSSSPVANRMLKCIEFGAKFQKEQDKNKYSEDDLKEAFRQGQSNMHYSDNFGLDSTLTEQQWFEQFKKK